MKRNKKKKKYFQPLRYVKIRVRNERTNERAGGRGETTSFLIQAVQIHLVEENSTIITVRETEKKKERQKERQKEIQREWKKEAYI